MSPSEEQAALWEDFNGNEPAFLELHLQFIQARTQDWKIRLAEYYDWLAIRSLDDLRHTNDDFLCRAYPQDCANDSTQLRNFKAWRRRETFASYRAKRIGTEFHGFMSLPAEIRGLIYEQVLVQGKVLLPRVEASPMTGSWLFKLRREDVYIGPTNTELRQRYKDTTTPIKDYLDHWPSQPGTMGLICGVSKIVHTEATRVFLSKNQFVFPQGSYDPLICFGKSYERAALKSQWLRDVSFAFTYGDYRTGRLCRHAHHETQSDSKPALVMESTNSTNQKYDTVQVEKIWRQRLGEIKNLTLSHLQLSFSDCICIYTRERKVAWVLDELMRDWGGPRPKVVEILDWEDDDEKEMIKGKLQSFAKCTEAGPMLVRFKGISGRERLRSLDDGWLGLQQYIDQHGAANMLANFDFDAFFSTGSVRLWDTPAHDFIDGPRP